MRELTIGCVQKHGVTDYELSRFIKTSLDQVHDHTFAYYDRIDEAHPEGHLS